ncbi:sporulation histidine kinase inhibitor Sda [Bacillus salipaludis]|uniref:Sporulation histidine kinase inhibitor Sda n=1 Tax=Bacillus salipaludis TaxID=2547811 RepID=A0A4R5VHV3_9BACI|nr:MULTISPECIES: sporulation histidine kinase inhibitor Sda [Bacillus]MDQ6598956.1 sporulation histidine kinase inhibitor Sda [Bacillus salipaludis]MED1472694.1 sporulation histidine kinase inhibitor Sda [Bacillus salipaludis]TDK53717.1 sporulation histidine kinase inhibitor Sda [Bacillus salipaludis]
MRFKTLSNEELIDIYLTAYEHKLNDSFLKMLLEEIVERDIYDLLLETGLQS